MMQGLQKLNLSSIAIFDNPNTCNNHDLFRRQMLNGLWVCLENRREKQKPQNAHGHGSAKMLYLQTELKEGMYLCNKMKLRVN